MYCCNDFKYHITNSCSEHGHECSDKILAQTNCGDVGIPIHDGGSAYIKINNCPWCGTKIGGNNDSTIHAS